jgi:hypothetical protein
MLTGLSVLNEVEDRLGKTQTATLEGTVSAETRKMLRLMNRVLGTMVASETWPMLREEGTILTQAPVNQGTLVNLTNGSTTVTISSFEAARAAAAGETPITFGVDNKTWAITFGTGQPVFRIASVDDVDEITLNRPWIGDDVAPASVDDDTMLVTFAQDRYALPVDFDRPTGKWEDFLSSYNVVAKGPENFAKVRRKDGKTIRMDDPRYYTVYGVDPTEAHQVLHLHPWPDKQSLLQFHYQKQHPEIEVDSDLILFPPTQMVVIIEAMLYLANRDYEDDTRFQVAMQEFFEQFKRVKGQNTLVTDHKQMTPKIHRARSVRMQKRSGVRWDYGDAFDNVNMVDLP